MFFLTTWLLWNQSNVEAFQEINLPNYQVFGDIFQSPRQYGQCSVQPELESKTSLGICSASADENASYKVKGVGRPAVIFSLEKNQEKITFDKETGSFVSGHWVKEKSFDKYLESIENYPRKN